MSSLLPEPGDMEPLEDIHFTVEAALVRELGSESVSDEVLSLIELIKNSYDADATEVLIKLENLRTGEPKIEIIDNGSGMSFDDLVNRWMRIATSWKRWNRISKKFKRKMLGLKGIGRFSVENLSAKTTIISYPENVDVGFKVVFDWNIYYDSEQDISKISNKITKFNKEKNVHGFKIILEDIRKRWSVRDVEKLRQYIRSFMPPYIKEANFNVEILTDEFKDLAGKIDSSFLSNALFKFLVILDKTGDIEYKFKQKGKKRPATRKSKFKDDFKCGPMKFELYFYYRTKKKMKDYGINIKDIDTFRKILDDYGNIRIYRDNIRISGFGNPDDDWIGLDALSRNDPSVVPARNQIISSIHITDEENPEITDTTTRENLIKNDSFDDMYDFIREAIAVFAQMRGEVEQKRKKTKSKGSRYVKKSRETLRKNINREPLLDFGKDYPWVFYENLEEEINLCYTNNLPNSTLILCRKVVENLLYNLFDYKFPKKVRLRYRVDQGRAEDFSVLLQNLEERIPDFEREHIDFIKKFLELVKPFRREANSTVHKVLEYLENIDELDALKIPEIIQLELELIRKVRQESVRARAKNRARED